MRRNIVALVMVAGVAALSISPTQRDFGSVGVLGIRVLPFHVTMASGATLQDSIFMSIAGADAGDFAVVNDDDRLCVTGYVYGGSRGHPGGCDVDVEFRPRSIGPKTARLQVRDGRGTIVTALLKGVGVAPVCTMTVVFCNYAHSYSGVFGWKLGINGSNSTYSENVEVTVTNGVAVCNGAAMQSENGRGLTGAITGSGLIAVEFEADPIYTWVYKITAACPTPAWPATQDSEAIPSGPADLGHNVQNSEKQPAGGVGLYLEQAIARLARLQGSITYPSPETDPVNGVSGSVTVSWSLLRS